MDSLDSKRHLRKHFRLCLRYTSLNIMPGRPESRCGSSELRATDVLSGMSSMNLVGHRAFMNWQWAVFDPSSRAPPQSR